MSRLATLDGAEGQDHENVCEEDRVEEKQNCVYSVVNKITTYATHVL